MTERTATQISVRENFFAEAPDASKVPGFNKPGMLTPKSDPDYILGRELGVVLGWFAMEPKDGLFIFGPTQCGKTTLIREICARTNHNLYELDGHEDIEISDMLGHYVNIGGDMIWQDGQLTLALRDPSGIFLLNEADAIAPGVLMKLHKLLEGREIVIDDNGGEIVPRPEHFRFIATGNTNGQGNASGSYVGTVQQNAAFMERFWVVRMDYLDEETEVQLLADKHQISSTIAKRMRAVASATRTHEMETFSTGEPELELPMSTHSLLRWGAVSKTIGMGLGNSKKAMNTSVDVAYANRLEDESRQAVHQIIQRVFDTP